MRGFVRPARPMFTLNNIPFLMGSWHLGLSRRELSRNSIPVTNLGERGQRGERGRGGETTTVRERVGERERWF